MPIDQAPPSPPRRALLRRGLALLPLPGLAACASAPWPDLPSGAGSSSARSRLQESAIAHGLAAWRQLQDVNVSYQGQWQGLVAQLQPELVDAGYRVSSQERLLASAGLVAQDHRGPAGHKQVQRRLARRDEGPGAAGAAGSTAADSAAASATRASDRGELALWRNAQPANGRDERDAAALVADAYRLFLFGPMALAGLDLAVHWGPPEDLDGRRCDLLQLSLAPGLGFAASDRLLLYIDRELGLMRRLRFSLDGLASTVGAVAEVDLSGHRLLHGVWWPTRFFERLKRPIPDLAVHDWRLTGLDVNRGYGAAAISGPAFSGAAVAPALPLPPA